MGKAWRDLTEEEKEHRRECGRKRRQMKAYQDWTEEEKEARREKLRGEYEEFRQKHNARGTARYWANRERLLAKNHTEHGRERFRRYYYTEKGQANSRRQRHSEKGKAARKRYTRSEKFKEVFRRYRRSEKYLQRVTAPHYREYHALMMAADYRERKHPINLLDPNLDIFKAR